jgi:hypothetical protein
LFRKKYTLTGSACAKTDAVATEPLPVSNTAHLRDLAQSAARIFDWNNNDKPGVQLNQQL